MPYDPSATKSRLLDAAFTEFVAYGLAGARVDRIAESANTNKQRIYAYFGSKEALFDTVLAERLGVLAGEVPFTPDDLPGYAGRYFDYLLAHPEHLRLALWRRLERPNPSVAEIAAYGAKVAAIAQSLKLDAKRVAPIDVLLLILGLAMAWAMAVPGVAAKDDPKAIARHRSAMQNAVTNALDALGAGKAATRKELSPIARSSRSNSRGRS